MTIEILFDMSMLQEFSAAISDKGGCRKLHGFEAEPVDDTDLYEWNLRLYDFEMDQGIAADMRAREIDHLALRISFPDDYPNAPPFVMMLRPLLKEGSGYVLNGGGICMELLTPTEWSPATSVNALVMSIRAMLVLGQARLRATDPNTKEPDYSVRDAKRDFNHIVKTHQAHGWTSHRMFKDG